MISNTDLLYIKKIVKANIHFDENPSSFMWMMQDEDSPIDDLYNFWDIPDIYDIKYGCSKAVLFCNFLDNYVLKMPYQGIAIGDNVYHVKFKNARFNNYNIESWDYCMKEAVIYEKACQQGVGDFFCGTYYLGMIDNFPIYVSEKSEDSLGDSEQPQSSIAAQKYIKSRRDKDNFLDFYSPGGMEDNIIGLFYDSWGEQKSNVFFNFLITNNIQDCHDDNVAFKDGKLRLIDYSGFDR